MYNDYYTSGILFSRDKSTIYFSIEDTSSTFPSESKDKIIYFSTNSNKIIREKYLSEFGVAGADGYLLYKGRNGIGIIKSFFYNTNHDTYFRVYDFDSDSGSDFIKHAGYTDPYLLGDGEYLILVQDTIKDGYKIYTGNIFYYNISDTQLIKSFNLPAGGEMYTFSDYLDDLYYVVDIDSPKRQIFRINSDSLLIK